MSRCIEKLRKAAKRGIALGLAAALTLSMLTVSTYAKAAKQPKPSLNIKRKTMYYDVFSRKTYNLKIKNIKANQIVSTTWKTSNKKAVTVSKKKDKSVLLTAKNKGKATITATVKFIQQGTKGTYKISKKRLTCRVTSKSDGASKKATPRPTGVVPTNAVQPGPTQVPTDTPVIDDEAPAVESAVITDYKTITVHFTEPVTGTPVVSVYDSEEKAVKQEAVLAEDGKSMTINCEEALPAGIYKIIINELSDLAGNEMEEDTSVQVEKENSIPKGFALKSERAPAGQGSFPVYFYVLDQYGQQCEVRSLISGCELIAVARTANSIPLQTNLNSDEGYLTVSGSPSLFAEGNEVEIALTLTAGGQIVCESKLKITMADASGLGKPVKFERFYIESDMETSGTDKSPEYILSDTEENNVLHVTARFLDEFSYVVDDADVTYTIDNKSVLAFADTSGTNSEVSNISSHGVAVKALAGGSAVITAHLSSDESLSGSMTVTVKPADPGTIQEDKSIQVEVIEEGTNGQPGKAKVTVLPEESGITAGDLECVIIKGEDSIDGEISFVQEEDGIYVNVTAEANGRDNDIQFKVFCDMGTEDESDDIISDVVTYKSAPLKTPNEIIVVDDEIVITVGSEGSTSYRILNMHGEDITNLLSEQPAFRIGDEEDEEDNIINVIVGSDDNIGILTVQALSEGNTEIELYMASNPSVSASVHVVVQKKEQHVGKIEFDELLEDELALNDTEAVIYAPIKVYDQNEEEFENFTKEVISEEAITITVNDIEQKGYKCDLEVFYCKGNSGNYEEADDEDNITAVGIRWKENQELKAKARDELNVKFKNINNPSFESGTFLVVVQPEKETVKVELNDMELELYLGLKDKDTAQLTASVSSDNNQSIEWISSDEDIVTVSKDGWVKAVTEGEATITASTENGEKAECTVTVIKPKEQNVPATSNTIKFTSEKDGEESTVNLNLLNKALDDYDSVFDALDKLVNELSDRGGNGSIYRNPDVDGDGKLDKVTIEKKAEDEVSLTVTVGEDKPREFDVKFLKIPDDKENSDKISATVTESGKEYVVTVQSDKKDEICVENKDGEMMVVKITDSGYTILASNGFGITIGDGK